MSRIVAFGALMSVAACSPRASGPLVQDAYVWQRAWTPAVRQAVAERGPRFARLEVLAAETRVVDGHLETVEVAPSVEALAGLDVVAVVRVGPWSGSFDGDPGLADLAAGTVSRWRGSGVHVTELQVDFDAASSQLAGYASWIGSIRRSSDVPVTLTALPDWLSRPELPALLDEADGWTLQLHDFAPPATSTDDLQPLVDVDEAERAIERAAALHRPFRVALPTYGYSAAFEPDGAFIGISSERSVTWQPGVVVRELDADPTQVADLVRRLQADRPPEVSGISWFRLPVDQDTRAWRWPTLLAVMAGRTPVARLTATSTSAGPGLVEIRVTNDGDGDAPLPDIAVRSGLPALAADGYGEWRADGHGSFRAREGGSLPAGTARAVGWVRFASDTEVTVDAL